MGPRVIDRLGRSPPEQMSLLLNSLLAYPFILTLTVVLLRTSYYSSMQNSILELNGFSKTSSVASTLYSGHFQNCWLNVGDLIVEHCKQNMKLLVEIVTQAIRRSLTCKNVFYDINSVKCQNYSSLRGLEPRTFELEVQHAIHCATGTG